MHICSSPDVHIPKWHTAVPSARVATLVITSSMPRIKSGFLYPSVEDGIWLLPYSVFREIPTNLQMLSTFF